MAWQYDLLPASWRGVPFGVERAGGTAGRNTAEHDYPYREQDPVWIEDAGLASSPHRIVGYLTGDDVAAQLPTMLAAARVAGQGQLVHPMLGTLTGSIVGGIQYELRRDAGRYIELQFVFIENAAVAPYPAAQPDTQGAVQTAATTAKASVASDFQSSIQGTIAGVRSQVQGFVTSTGLPQVVSEIGAFGSQAQRAVGDATSLFNSARNALGGLGRYVSPTGIPGITTVSGALSAVNQARTTVTGAVSTMNRLANLL